MYKSQIEPVYLLFCTRRRLSDVSWQKSGGNEGVKLPDSALNFLSKLLVTSLLNNRKKNIHVSWHLQASMERETWSPLWCKCRGGNWKWERLRKKKKDQPEGSIASFFSFPLLVRIDWLKINPAGLRSDRVASTDDRTGQSVTSDAARIIQPVFIYVEIELLSAKSCESVAVSCQLRRGRQNTTALTDWRVRLSQTNGWILCRFHA